MAENANGQSSGADGNFTAGKNEAAREDDLLGGLDVLSKKYGLDFQSDKPSQPSKYAPWSAQPAARTHAAPKNNAPAKTPQIVYSSDPSSPGIKVIFEDSAAQGAQGRRTVYSDDRPETAASRRLGEIEKRRAAAGKRSVYSGSDSQPLPYSKRVAGDRDSTDTRFKRVYESSVQQEHTKQEKPKSETDENIKSERIADRHYKSTPKSRARSFFGAFLPMPGDGAREVLRKIIMDISAVLVLICFGYFIDNYLQHQKQLENADKFREQVSEGSSDDDLEARWAAIKEKYPDVDFPDGMNIRFAELYAANQDLVGWLHIDNTNIDAAVVHHPEDAENDADEDYYLRRNFYGQSDKYGCLFLDRYNTGSSLNDNNIIYGHNMMDGLAFAQLEKYYTVDGFRESPIIEYSTLFEDYKFKVYAAFITNGYASGDNGYLFNYPTVFFESEESYAAFIEAIDERKLYDTGVDISTDDKLIILSTCSYEIKQTDMGRLAVVGRLVRDGESESVDTSKATVNANPRYPQIWYDEHNMSNPFADAYQWSQSR